MPVLSQSTNSGGVSLTVIFAAHRYGCDEQAGEVTYRIGRFSSASGSAMAILARPSRSEQRLLAQGAFVAPNRHSQQPATFHSLMQPAHFPVMIVAEVEHT
jgi:hypothetical protein